MLIPRHVAIIPDGNRRWARKRGLPVIEGHRKGSETLGELAKVAKELNIHTVSFWAFSTENWDRTRGEVRGLMALFEHAFKKRFHDLIKNKIHFHHIGRKDRIPASLLQLINETEKKTKQFNTHYFVLGLDYGGRDEILRAIKKIEIKNLNEENFSALLDTSGLPYPYPDLVIRTGGEKRTSGFMIWQTAYSEWIFHPKYFPDFTPKDLQNCIREYSKRQRRFGK